MTLKLSEESGNAYRDELRSRFFKVMFTTYLGIKLYRNVLAILRRGKTQPYEATPHYDNAHHSSTYFLNVLICHAC